MHGGFVSLLSFQVNPHLIPASVNRQFTVMRLGEISGLQNFMHFFLLSTICHRKKDIVDEGLGGGRSFSGIGFRSRK